MILAEDSVRFLPSKLSKTDRVGHMGPAIRIARLPFTDHCPVYALEEYLIFRSALVLQHDCQLNYQHHMRHYLSHLSLAIFRLFFAQRAFTPRRALHALWLFPMLLPPVRPYSILRAGDWSGAQTSFRFYCRDLDRFECASDIS